MSSKNLFTARFRNGIRSAAGAYLLVGAGIARSLAFPSSPAGDNQKPVVSPTSTPAPNEAGPASSPAASSFTLVSAASQAFVRNPAMVQATGKLQAAEARLNEQLSLRFPQPGLTVTATENKASGYTIFPTLNAALSIPLDTAGRTGDLVRQARADLGNAQWVYRRSQVDLVFQVVTGYSNALRAYQDRLIAEDAYAQAQAQAQAAQIRVDAGDVPQTDVLKAQVQAARAHADLLIAQSAEQQARAGFNNVVATDIAAPTTLAAMDTAPNPAPLDQLQTALEQSSPEIRSARSAVISAEAGVALARVESRPQVNLQGIYNYTQDPTTYPHAIGAGVSVTVPLPDGGGRHSREAQAKAALAQARAALNLARRQALLDLRNAYLAVGDTRQRMDITAQGVTLADESLRAANLGYANGVATTRDVIDAQVALRVARGQQTQAIYDYNVSVARVYNVLGLALPGITLPAAPGLREAGL